MAGEIQAAFDAVYTNGPATSPDEPRKELIRSVVGATIQSQMDNVRTMAEGAAAGYVIGTTWPALAAIEGTREGQPGRVPTADTGTHTGRYVNASGNIVSGTVPNSGEYAWNGSFDAWVRTGDVIDPAALDAEIAAIGINVQDAAINAELARGAQLAIDRGWPVPPTAGVQALAERSPYGFTLVRATEASRTDVRGYVTQVAENEFPHDYDPLTGEYRGWLLEPPATNGLLQSSDLLNAYWSTTRGSLAVSSIVAPDGVQTFFRFSETAETGVHSFLRAGLPVSLGAIYTFSLFVKADSRNAAAIQFDSDLGGAPAIRAAFNLVTGAVISTTEGVIGARIKPYGNGVYRISMTLAARATSNSGRIIFSTAIGSDNNFAGTAGAGLYFWGPQWETNNAETAYIPTSGAAVTRDVSAVTGLDIPSVAEGTLFARFSIRSRPSPRAYIATLYSDPNRAGIVVNANGQVYFGYIVDNETVQVNGPVPDLDGDVWAAVSWKDGQQLLAVNGTSYSGGSAPGLPGAGYLVVGSIGGTASPADADVKEVFFFPRAMTAAQLAVVTNPNVTPAEGGYSVARQYVEVYSDVSKDMCLVWHADAGNPASVEYRALGATNWQSAGATVVDFPSSTEKVYSARVINLSPDTVYEWRPAGSGSQTIRTFRTAPEYLSRDLRVCVVSDAQGPQSQYPDPESIFNTINDLIALDEPDLILIAGDLVADDGVQSNTVSGWWRNFMDAISARFVRSDGTMIPICAMTGNHEVSNEGEGSFSGHQPRGYVDKLFNCFYRTNWQNVGGSGYGYFSIGREVLFVCLDTNHGSPISEQVPWLAGVMSDLAPQYRHVVIGAHVPPWSYSNDQWDTPSIANWGLVSEMVRRDVMPLVQDHPNVRFMVTGHLHNILATPLLKIDPAESGTQQRWYLDPDGMRILGTGGWIGVYQRPFQTANRVSDIDGSSWVDMALATEGPTIKNITPISPPTGDGYDPAIKHYWRIEFRADEVEALCINLNGGVYKAYTETVG